MKVHLLFCPNEEDEMHLVGAFHPSAISNKVNQLVDEFCTELSVQKSELVIVLEESNNATSVKVKAPRGSCLICKVQQVEYFQ